MSQPTQSRSGEPRGDKDGIYRPDTGLSPGMRKRLIVVGALFCAVVVPVLIGSIFNIQFLAERNGRSYAELALDSQLRDTTVAATRGTIYDRNGKVLAQNATVWTIDMYPSEIQKIADKYTDPAVGEAKVEELCSLIADRLSVILDMDREEIYGMTRKNVSYIAVKSKVEKEVKDLVTEFIVDSKLSCIRCVSDSKRYYPYGNFAAAVLGFTGKDNQGLGGVEIKYDTLLKGIDGRIITLKNANNVDMPSEYESTVDPIDGSNLVLTIDEVVQMYLEKHLEQALIDHNVGNRVAGVIMDVNTGEILAMATKGDYDPNEPFTVSDEEVAEDLEKLEGDDYLTALSTARNAQWKNKLVSEVYEPGSVFKIITAAAALEEGVVTPTDTFTCTGSLKVGDRVIHCWKRDGSHGTQTFGKALCNSCNPVFMTVAARLGATKFMEYFEAFGLTEKTGIDLPGEEVGIAHVASQMGAVELAVSSFGQTFKVTPIQMITAVSAVANGGYLMQPHIVKSIVSADGVVEQTFEPTVRRQVISEETSKTMCELLAEVVSGGSGRNAYVAGYRVAGKTGTSEKTDLYDADGNKISKVIASFCGFAPADDPQIAVLILLDEPDSFSNFGGQIAAPVVADILEDVLPYLGIEPVYTETELANLNITAPTLVGLSTAKATAEAEKKGLKVKTVGSGDKVLYQVPAAGSEMPKNGTVVLVLSENAEVTTVKVPDLRGKSLGGANSELANRGLNVCVSGARAGSSDAVISSQTPAAGEIVEIGTVVTVRLSYADQVE